MWYNTQLSIYAISSIYKPEALFCILFKVKQIIFCVELMMWCLPLVSFSEHLWTSWFSSSARRRKRSVGSGRFWSWAWTELGRAACCWVWPPASRRLREAAAGPPAASTSWAWTPPPVSSTSWRVRRFLFLTLTQSSSSSKSSSGRVVVLRSVYTAFTAQRSWKTLRKTERWKTNI